MHRNTKNQLSYKHFSLSTTFIPHVLKHISNTTQKKKSQQIIYLKKYKHCHILSPFSNRTKLGLPSFALCSAFLRLHPLQNSVVRSVPTRINGLHGRHRQAWTCPGELHPPSTAETPAELSGWGPEVV